MSEPESVTPEQICEQAIERNFQAAWAVADETAKCCNPSPETAEWFRYSLKEYARRWYMLGRNAAESGVGAGIMQVNHPSLQR